MLNIENISIRNKNISSIKKNLCDEFESICSDFFDSKKQNKEITIVNYNDEISINNILEPQNDDNWLGSYSPMRSPGKIKLNKKNIIELSKFIFNENLYKKPFGHSINLKDSRRIISMVFEMILYHELFHYFCDVMIPYLDHKKTNFIPDEEALAVAFSFLYAPNRLNYYSSFNKYNFEELFFDKIKSTGYRDWVNYKKMEDFSLGVMKYINYDSVLSFYEDHLSFPSDQNNRYYRFNIFISSIVSNPNVEFQLN